jgi:hypothetical protein
MDFKKATPDCMSRSGIIPSVAIRIGELNNFSKFGRDDAINF